MSIRISLLLAWFSVFAFALPAVAADTVRPTISHVSPTSATAGQSITLTATYNDDDSGVALCDLYVEFANVGAMTLNDGVASLAYTFPTQGAYAVFVHCKDAAGNAANGPNTSVLVTTSNTRTDFTPPTVSVMTPSQVLAGQATLFTAEVQDNDVVTSCQLIVNGFSQGEMAIASGHATRSYTFEDAGTAQMYAQCADASGNAGSGAPVTIMASDAPPPVPTPEPEPEPVTTPALVKLACPADSTVSHPCRSVYYRSSNGERHAFPNERVFFTWYSDFSTVQEISAADMAALMLSTNVTYRPGVKMVKFITDPKVYAVAKQGTLRWVASEAIASALYGPQWNKQIDDLSDAFAGDYHTGVEIMQTNQFVPATVRAETPTIESNL